jgi:acetoin utilization deacetylase AcuC-like enzyme
LDLDFHHGNGTQDVFYHDPSVLYVSIHGRDEYPYYTGFESETGAGAGKDYNLNLPLPAGSSISQYLEKLRIAVERLVEFEPEYLIVSLGFDTFHLDPLGGFKIDVEDYNGIAREIKEEERLKGVPSMILLEGGYVVGKLGECMVSFLRGWDGETRSG